MRSVAQHGAALVQLVPLPTGETNNPLGGAGGALILIVMSQSGGQFTVKVTCAKVEKANSSKPAKTSHRIIVNRSIHSKKVIRGGSLPFFRHDRACKRFLGNWDLQASAYKCNQECFPILCRKGGQLQRKFPDPWRGFASRRILGMCSRRGARSHCARENVTKVDGGQNELDCGGFGAFFSLEQAGIQNFFNDCINPFFKRFRFDQIGGLACLEESVLCISKLLNERGEFD